MHFLKFKEDPVFQDVANKYLRHPPVVGLIGTTIGILKAFRNLALNGGSPIDKIAPAILDALFWSAGFTGTLILIIFLHYWWIKRR
jgi:hypothetical protein